VQAALAQALEDRGWLETPLAVRSSAPQEDSSQRSFAGMHETRLNVIGVQALAEAVQAVWDSAQSPQALAYRARLEIDSTDLAMAVVVMPMLPAVVSGIAFTCDPLLGRDDQLIINAHWGLGEALVSGQTDGDTYRLQASPIDDSLHVLERHIGSKQRMTQPRANGGTALVDTPPAQAARAVLDDAQLMQLAALARDAARALDFAQARYDIEWVWDGARFWIVQARPVTTRGRHTYAALQPQQNVWTRGNTREVFPDPRAARHGPRGAVPWAPLSGRLADAVGGLRRVRHRATRHQRHAGRHATGDHCTGRDLAAAPGTRRSAAALSAQRRCASPPRAKRPEPRAQASRAMA
jgi:pyruvate,water dikinase